MRAQMGWLKAWAAIGLCLLLQACNTPPRLPATAHITHQSNPSEWQGRLSVQVQSETPSSMTAGFWLRGNAHQGELDLYSPLGTTLGALQWSPQRVQLSQGGSHQLFASLTDLTEKTTGAALPIDAIFQWLQGVNAPAAGWQADLSDLSQGLLTARRTSPRPEVTLRIKLD